MLKRKFLLATVLALFGFIMFANSATAFELKVTYSNKTVTGPVCLGLAAVPDTIDVIFELRGSGTSRRQR